MHGVPFTMLDSVLFFLPFLFFSCLLFSFLLFSLFSLYKHMTGSEQQRQQPEGAARRLGLYLGIRGIVDIHELVYCPVEPAHEEHPQG